MTNGTCAMQRIDDVGLNRAQAALIIPKAKGTDRQKEFLQIVLNDEQKFCDTVRGWGITAGEAPALPSHPFSESEFLKPPWSTEKLIFETWQNMTPNDAARASVWTRVHLAMIEAEWIKATYLAADNGSGDQRGRVRIKEALDTDDPTKIDGCVRAVFRRMGGVLRDRATRTAYIDCPVARSWWRHRYAKEVNHHIPELEIQAISELLNNTTLWESLIEAMVSRLTIIGDQRIRPSVIAGTLRAQNENIAVEMKSLLNVVGQRSTTQALGVLPVATLTHIVREELIPPLAA